jgi:hypothetical protein
MSVFVHSRRFEFFLAMSFPISKSIIVEEPQIIWN